MSGAILEARGLEKTFGAVVAAHNINVAMQRGEVVGVIGANGAGKTTFINMVTGYLTPSAGSIHFDGSEITGLAPRTIVQRGLGRSFQIPQLFGTLSARDNLLVALGIAAPDGLSWTKPLRRKDMVAQADAALETFGLLRYADTEARGLPQGVRKVLDVAMATVRNPRLILLDEPTSAVSAEEKFPVMETLMRALTAASVTVLFVEHDMDVVAKHARRVIAFYDGTIIADAPPEQALAADEVKKYVIGEKVG
jgi:branched-chain amino acid transport system ATP-binding protein